jgi:predicted nuclease of predicted toxin-antitoxin system
MKILLDENIDVRFKRLFVNSSHEVFTIRDMKWSGIKNGALLQLLKEHDFHCWIVVDKNLPYQQNLAKIPCMIVVLDVFRNTLKHISPLFPKLLVAIESTKERKVIVISEQGE